MTKNHSKTLHYYNQSAQTFVQATIDADLSKLHHRFKAAADPGSHSLDLGCGSGRDAKAFLDAGYRVTAIDGTPGCCQLVSDHIGQEVLCQNFEKLDCYQAFDGVWSCASLLHMPELRNKK